VNIELLERAAVALGELVEDVMFVGGATIELWLTDPGAVDIRPTLDVDVVVEVTSRLAFYNFEAELRRRGFAEDPSGIIIRVSGIRVPPPASIARSLCGSRSFRGTGRSPGIRPAGRIPG
jgi:hypothetical protein